ncbi:MAG: porin family protein [Saprospiraceae bacterium]
MKRPTFLMALLCLLATNQLFAQSTSIFIGTEGGFNISKLQYTEDLKELYPTSNFRTGINAGVKAGFEMEEWIFTTGLNFIQKGGKYQTDNFDDGQGVGFISAKERINYLSIPITVGYQKWFYEKLGAAISIGPSINFGLKGKIDETYEYFGIDEVDKEHYEVSFGKGVNDDYKKTQIGFQIIPSLFYKVNDKGRVHLSVNWDMGTSDSFNPRYKSANDFFYDYKGNQLNQSVMFTIGYTRHFNFEDKY